MIQQKKLIDKKLFWKFYLRKIEIFQYEMLGDFEQNITNYKIIFKKSNKKLA